MFIQIDSESFLHLYKLLHNGMLGMVVLDHSTVCTLSEDTLYRIHNKSMGDRVSCYYSLCHLFIHPATISTHQEYLPIFKTMWTPPLYPYCSSHWEIKSVLATKYPFDDGMSLFITLKLTTWTWVARFYHPHNKNSYSDCCPFDVFTWSFLFAIKYDKWFSIT